MSLLLEELKGAPVELDDIEILDWVENAQWRKISIHLPVHMYDPQLAVSNDKVFVVGYIDAKMSSNNRVYELPVAVITNSTEQQCTSTRWVELGKTTHHSSSPITGLSSLMVVGGRDATGTTEDIKMYDIPTRKWNKIDSRSFARFDTAATAINNNSIIIIGGCTSIRGPLSFIVKLGHVEEV